MSFLQRTHACGDLRAAHESQTVILNGWAHRVRDLGGLFFVDFRDRTGIVQLVFPLSRPGGEGGRGERAGDMANIRSEACLSVSGTVRMRNESTRNPKMATGDIEVEIESFSVLSPAKILPFPVSDEDQMLGVNEELRIKHRYLDIRRPKMYRTLALRAAVIRKIRAFLDERDFLEIETPIITRSTPEGARDYLVPYRIEPGKFYALPQSPQQYKQLLMVAGCERYYQIAKCFRDESQRADRQPEFTQLDLEMSFVHQEDVLSLSEDLLRQVCNEVIAEFGLPLDPIEPFARLSYDEAIHLYGCDKPDLRFGLQLFDITDEVRESEFSVFRTTAEKGGLIRGVRYPGGSGLSRKDIGELETLAKEFGAKGMATLSVEDSGEATAPESGYVSAGGLSVKGSIAKFFKPAELEAIVKKSRAEAGDLLLLIADEYMAGNNVLFRLRNEIGDRCGLRDKRKLNFCWILDFPLVEWDEATQTWSPSHHPFTAPKDEDLLYIDSDPGRIRADCYDVVCNGTEMASGSIRIHRSDVQAKIFTLLGIDPATQQERFGHILEAFQYGAPPHGGIAPGIDRLVMVLLDEENIREVMAFPKIGQGYDPLMDAPSTIDEAQWAELGLALRPAKP